MSAESWQDAVHAAVLASLERSAKAPGRHAGGGETAESLRQALGYANTGSVYGLKTGKSKLSAGQLVRLVAQAGDAALRLELLALMSAEPMRGVAVSGGIGRGGLLVRRAVMDLIGVLEELCDWEDADSLGRREALGSAFGKCGAAIDRLASVRAAINEQTARELARREAKR